MRCNVNKAILDDMIDLISQKDMILIGIGEQIAFPTKNMDDNEVYSGYIKNNDDVIYPYLQQAYISENCQEYIEFYNRLHEIIKDKNYFIVTTNVDDIIYKSNLNPEKIVAPCGSISQFICPSCQDRIDVISEDKVSLTKKIVYGNLVDKIDTLKCIHCAKEMMPNIVTYPHYDEKGYLEQWGKYTKWLQGTVNRKLAILELGVGLNYPTVIRWPNEKIVTYNNKAFMYRIHSRFSQLSEGIGDRAKSISENPMNII